MNKSVLTAGVSVLSTLAVVGGTLGILANIPSTKDKINISWEQTDLIGKNQGNISNLKNEIKEKDNQIQCQQVTIEELNQMLNAGPESISISEDIVLDNGIAALKMSDDVMLFSSIGPNGTKGFWKLDKNTKKITQLVDFGYNWFKIFKLSDGRFLVFNTLSSYDYLLLDSSFSLISTLTCDDKLLFSYSTDYSVFESENFYFFGSSTANNVYVFNKQTNVLIKNQDLEMSYSCVYGNYFIHSNSETKMYIWDFENNSTETLTTTSCYLPIVYKNDVYLLSKTTISKFDLVNKSISVLKEGLNLSSLPSYYKIIEDEKFNIITYGSYGSSVYDVCLIDMETLDLVSVGKFLFDKVERNKINNNILMFYSSSTVRSFDLSTNTSKNYVSVNPSKYFVLDDKYVVVFTSSNITITEIGLGNKFSASVKLSSLYSSYEDMGDGKYKFISESQIAVWDSVANTFTIHSLIIE